MAKTPIRYYDVNPWKVIERGFDKERSEASESIFCLGNEYMGIRGFFEETYTGSKLIGTYFNGIYEVPLKPETGGYLGISHKSHFMINAVNFLYTRIYLDGEEIDLNKIEVKDFYRELDFKTGQLLRKFTYKDVTFTFKRLLEMDHFHHAYQQIHITSNHECHVRIETGMDYSINQWHKVHFWKLKDYSQNEFGIQTLGKTRKTKQRIITNCEILLDNNLVTSPINESKISDKLLIQEINLHFDNEHSKHLIEKRITVLKEKDEKVKDKTLKEMLNQECLNSVSYESAYQNNQTYYQNVWDKYDIVIKGDEANQQGIRFCIFAMQQTYQGIDKNSNIGAKGLTGEAYSGNAFWDTEAYCLPFFLFNNPKAAKDLLMFRVNTLPQAMLRAKELDCVGACYPIATLNGNEACNLWQHASCQLQPTTAVCYGIWHYVNLTNDTEFLYHDAIDVLIEASRFLVSRGDWNSSHTHFGFFGVMGPDEFQMMVNHNTYTNYMGKRSIEYTVKSLKALKENDLELYKSILNKHNLDENEINNMKIIAKQMYIIYDEKTKLFEQHDGYYELPHIDIKKIPVTDFPLYSHWSYDHLYRNDMIKQPDVLMMMFLYNQSFTFEQKLNNYEFYEPRTIHESSLSPSIHSVLALELGKLNEGLDFFGYATRMDLDDFNRNTCEGIHITSIAAAWVNIIYGFGGVRSDGQLLKIAPVIPDIWDAYEFNITYHEALINVHVSKTTLKITTSKPITIQVFNEKTYIENELVMELNHE